jgi:hypothetical protein
VDHKQASLLVAEGHWLLTEGNVRIERQRAIITRLEELGIDTVKQTQLLTRLIEAHEQQTRLAVEALDWLEANAARGNRPLATPPTVAQFASSHHFTMPTDEARTSSEARKTIPGNEENRESNNPTNTASADKTPEQPKRLSLSSPTSFPPAHWRRGR